MLRQSVSLPFPFGLLDCPSSCDLNVTTLIPDPPDLTDEQATSEQVTSHEQDNSADLD